MMKRFIGVTLCIIFLFNGVFAESIRGIEIDFVTINHPGNSGDKSDGADNLGSSHANPYTVGAVEYIYQIGKYEVTNGQWNSFVSMSGTPTGTPDYAYDEHSCWNDNDNPVNNVSWYEAAQFCNFLTSGDKSKGAYQFSGDNSNPGAFVGIDRQSAVSFYGTVYVIPTEDEWYKAAYYTKSGYSLFANGTDDAATIDDGWNDYSAKDSSVWAVGSGAIEQNGTYDMMGNVWEWNETLVSDSNRGLRGGSCFGCTDYLSAEFRNYSGLHADEISSVGFRVAVVPEPATMALFVIGGLVIRKKRVSTLL